MSFNGRVHDGGGGGGGGGGGLLDSGLFLALEPGLGFMAVVDFATSDFETCPKYQNWANFINKSRTES